MTAQVNQPDSSTSSHIVHIPHSIPNLPRRWNFHPSRVVMTQQSERQLNYIQILSRDTQSRNHFLRATSKPTPIFGLVYENNFFRKNPIPKKRYYRTQRTNVNAAQIYVNVKKSGLMQEALRPLRFPTAAICLSANVPARTKIQANG
jgi:hypothetical protein